MFSYTKRLNLNKIQLRTINYWTVRHWYAKLWRKKPEKPPYSHIIQIGDPRLRFKSKEIPLENIKSNEIQSLITRLKYVLKRYDCVGISAPQIGIGLRLFALEFSDKHIREFSETEVKSREMSVLPLTIFINPNLKIIDYKKVVFPESCESVKGFSADVSRFRSVELSGFDENGEKIKIGATGWLARIIQHEMDHLDGKIYTDIMNKESFACCCWEVVNESRGKVVLPFTPD